jgi:hypothetical protein
MVTFALRILFSPPQKHTEYTGNQPNIPEIELYFVNKVTIFHFLKKTCALLKNVLARSVECFSRFTRPNRSFTHHGEWSSGIVQLCYDKWVVMMPKSLYQDHILPLFALGFCHENLMLAVTLPFLNIS